MAEKIKRKLRNEKFLAKLLFVSAIIFVLSMSTVFAQFMRSTGDEGWGYGYGYGYGLGYGWDSGATAGYRTDGGSLSTYAYGYGYGYMLEAPSGGVYTVAAASLSSLANTGLVDVAGGDMSSTTQLTFNDDVAITATGDQGTVTITIPTGTTMTTSTAADFTALAATDARSSVSITDLDVRFGLQFGVAGETITLSQAVTLAIPVDASMEGETLSVYRSASPTSGYTLLGTCVVSSYTCSFTTTTLSYFTGGITASSESSGGGGGGGGVYAPVPTQSTVVDLTVDANGGALVKTNATGGSMRVVVPSNAVSANTTFEMFVTNALGQGISLPASSSGWFMADNQMYQLTASSSEQDVTLFAAPLTLEISYVDSQITWLEEDSLALFYWDIAKGKWVQLDSTVDMANNTVSAETQHLTVFALFGNKSTVTADGDGIVTSAEQFVPAKPAVQDLAAERQALGYFMNLTKTIPSGDMWSVVHFIAYGTPESSNMSIRDRQGVVGDYEEIYDRVPTTAADWQDIALILTSHKPLQRNEEVENAALYDFKKVYKRLPDYSNVHDEWAMYYIGYNIRNVVRNIDSEKFAIGTFRSIYRYVPSSSHHWSIMRAIAYSGASR